MTSSLALSGCSFTHDIDDIDLAYYVHHLSHYTFNGPNHVTKAVVTLKPFKTDEVYRFVYENIVWENEYYDWTGWCEDEESYKYNDYYFSPYAILTDDLVSDFVNDSSEQNIFSFSEYYEEEGFIEETSSSMHRSTLFRQRLSLYKWWVVTSYTSKTPRNDGYESETDDYNYENYRQMNVISELVYEGENIQYLKYYIGGRGLYIMNQDAWSYEFNENFREEAIDYLEYRVSFY